MNCQYCGGRLTILHPTPIPNKYQGICGFCRQITWVNGPLEYDPPYPAIPNEPKPRLNFSEMLILSHIAQREEV